MSYKLNPFTGILDIVGDGGFSKVTKFNPFSGKMDLTAGGANNLKYNPFSGRFDIEGGSFVGATQAEIDALEAFYNATDGDNWTNTTGWFKYPNVGDWFGVTVSGGNVTQISLTNNSLNGALSGSLLNPFADLNRIVLSNQSTLSGDISGWTIPTTLDFLIFSSTSVSGDISGWTLPLNLGRLLLDFTSVSGDISGWTLPAVRLTHIQLQNTSVSGDISGWILPSTLEQFYAQNTSVSGDISGWILPAAIGLFHLSNTSISGAPVFTSAVVMSNLDVSDCGLSVADVDAWILGVYNRRASFTAANPALLIGGTNAAPSATGLTNIQNLVYDPAAEGFNVWSITHTTPTYAGADAAEITALISFYYATGGPYWTNNTNWITALDVGTWNGVTVAGGHVTVLTLGSNNLVGAADLTDLDWLLAANLHINALTSFTAAAATITTLNCRDNSISSAIDSSALTGLVNFYCYGNSIPTIDVSTNLDLKILQAQDNGMNEAAIDSLMGGIYTVRASYTFAGPIVADIGGTNADPSGTYQYSASPATGEEERYALENDDDVEGFTLWTIGIT